MSWTASALVVRRLGRRGDIGTTVDLLSVLATFVVDATIDADFAALVEHGDRFHARWGVDPTPANLGTTPRQCAEADLSITKTDGRRRDPQAAALCTRHGQHAGPSAVTNAAVTDALRQGRPRSTDVPASPVVLMQHRVVVQSRRPVTAPGARVQMHRISKRGDAATWSTRLPVALL